MVENEDSKISGTQTRIKNDATKNREIREVLLSSGEKKRTDEK